MTNARETASPPNLNSVPLDPGSSRPVEVEPSAPSAPLPITAADPDFGLSRKGSGEDAIVRRETEI